MRESVRDAFVESSRNRRLRYALNLRRAENERLVEKWDEVRDDWLNEAAVALYENGEDRVAVVRRLVERLRDTGYRCDDRLAETIVTREPEVLEELDG